MARRDAPPARGRRATAGATWPSSTAPTPRAGCWRSSWSAQSIPYKVVGGTRFYDRREVKDALAYLRAVVNPADEVSLRRILNVPKRGVGDTSVGPARGVGHRPTAAPSSTPWPRPRRRASAGGRSPASASSASLLDELLRARARRGRRGRRARGGRWRTRLRGRAGGRALHRGRRAGWRTWPSWWAWPASTRRRRSRPRRADRRRFLETVSLVADADELDRRRVQRRAHDPAHGQGPGVRRRVHDRPGGRRLPPPALAGRARRARGGAPPLLRRHHPGPTAAVPLPRLEPDAVRVDAVQPAQPLPQGDPGAAHRADRGRAPRPGLVLPP